MDSQEENIKIANILGNNQEKKYAGILQRRGKYQEIFFTLFNYLHLILLKLCVISCVSHLMTYFSLLFVLEAFFSFHNRLYDLSSNNISPYLSCIMTILGQILTSQFSYMPELKLA